MPSDFYTICLCKGAERYILLVDHATRGAAMRTLGRWASDPELSFTWHNAAVLCQRIREILNEGTEHRSSSKEAAMLFITFINGPFDGETRTYLRPQPAMTEVYQDGSATAFVYRLKATPHGLRYVFDRAYRPAAQDCRGK